ncbi:hypothetical protein [Methanococcus maripaludis]|uniref:Uncharacterized protein n=1 Tax=Methanococcus maripaludis TaxID=39152 RepID=A0A8T4CJB8_METMI|nr:hypothetical protein [Methanococcus maripaludis]MBM7408780.1 hypothetical protein [Methanococcus maripaludis]MBP2219051.1 hypothetical protein [Methanococcus maripaludis]
MSVPPISGTLPTAQAPNTLVQLSSGNIVPATAGTTPVIQGILSPSGTKDEDGNIAAGTMANMEWFGVQIVKIKDGETIVAGDLINADPTTFEAIKDNVNGVFEVVRVRGSYADVWFK